MGRLEHMIILMLDIFFVICEIHSSDIQQNVYTIPCGQSSDVQTLQMYKELRTRSRIECCVMCSKHLKCASSEFGSDSDTCYLFSGIETDCNQMVDSNRHTYIERSKTTWCDNGGTPSASADVLCHCVPGYTGLFCETEIDECVGVTCQRGVVCQDLLNMFVCQCPPMVFGVYCEIAPCDSNPCQNNGVCNATSASGYICDCVFGFSGSNCETDGGHEDALTDLTVTNGGTESSFGSMDYCPTGSYAAGFQLQTEEYQGNGGVVLITMTDDDTSVNSVKLLCKQLTTYIQVATVSSDRGNWGTWEPIQECPHGYFITNFMLKVQPYQGSSGDDTFVNNMKSTCTDIVNGGVQEIEGIGMQFGVYGSWSNDCEPGTLVCAISTRVRGDQGLFDDSSLNDVKLRCCRYQ